MFSITTVLVPSSTVTLHVVATEQRNRGKAPTNMLGLAF